MPWIAGLELEFSFGEVLTKVLESLFLQVGMRRLILGKVLVTLVRQKSRVFGNLLLEEIMKLDPVAVGVASFWKYENASEITKDKTYECDVVVVGSGAGGGTSAELLAAAGFKVIIIEEGPLKYTQHFKMNEAEAYSDLYQESMTRQTKDGGIHILQGRSVGGSTTVNWTSSFKTPDVTLSHWKKKYNLEKASPSDLKEDFKPLNKNLVSKSGKCHPISTT